VQEMQRVSDPVRMMAVTISFSNINQLAKSGKLNMSAIRNTPLSPEAKTDWRVLLKHLIWCRWQEKQFQDD
jgi:hypothetical protein